MQGERMSKKKYDPSDAIKIMEKRLELLDTLILRERECRDAGEHRYEEGKADGRCTHCYTPAEGYHATETDAILKGRHDLPVEHQPCDAPVMMERARKEISDQKYFDLDNRIALLDEEQNAR